MAGAVQAVLIRRRRARAPAPVDSDPESDDDPDDDPEPVRDPERDQRNFGMVTVIHLLSRHTSGNPVSR
jgi:hypothetical protein